MPPRSRFPVPAVAGLALSLAALAGPLAAQAPEAPAPPRAVRVYPRFGILRPDTYFYEYFKNFTGDGLTEWTTGYLGRAYALGAGLEVRLGDTGVRLRGEAVRSLDGWLSVGHSVETLRDLFFPPEVVTTWLDVPTTLTLVSAQVVLPTKLELGPVEPYVLVGGGGKHYAFGEPTTTNEVEATLPNAGFTWGAEVGGGVTFRAGGLQVDLQARDAISKYWGKYQHDILYSGALSLGLR